MNKVEIEKITLLNRKQGYGFYALIERVDGKKYHIVGKYKSYKNGELIIKTFTSLPFIVQIEKEKIINKMT